MAKITKISEPPQKPDRVWVFIDGEYCASVRKRTFQAMNLKVGDEISCKELKEKEDFFWKKAYGEEAWKKEKVRIDAAKNLIENIDTNVLIKIVGFGADTTELIEKHPDEMGKPDLDILHKMKPQVILLKVEVTGTEIMRGTGGYWVRPDKLKYAENNPDENVWIILHYAQPKEKFVFVKPVKGKKYQKSDIDINEATEHYCIFNDGDEEVKTLEEFSAHLRQKLDEAVNKQV